MQTNIYKQTLIQRKGKIVRKFSKCFFGFKTETKLSFWNVSCDYSSYTLFLTLFIFLHSHNSRLSTFFPAFNRSFVRSFVYSNIHFFSFVFISLCTKKIYHIHLTHQPTTTYTHTHTHTHSANVEKGTCEILGITPNAKQRKAMHHCCSHVAMIYGRYHWNTMKWHRLWTIRNRPPPWIMYSERAWYFGAMYPNKRFTKHQSTKATNVWRS